MRIAVTGSDGYIGRVLAGQLVAQGHDVVGIDSCLYEGCSFEEIEPTWLQIRADIRDIRSEDLKGIEAVCHLAALSNDPLGALDPHLTWSINVEGTSAVARAAREAGVLRFVFASSCSVYGAPGDGSAVGEWAPVSPLTEYAKSKVAAEGILASLSDNSFATVVLRQATAFGWSERFRLDLVLNEFVASALVSGRIVLRFDGRSWRPLAHVQDLAAAFACALLSDNEAVAGETLNVGSDDSNYLIRNLADLVARETGAVVEFAATAVPDTRSYRVSFARIAERLPAWRPGHSAEDGVREMIDRLRSYAIEPRHLLDARFRRVDTLDARRRSGSVRTDLRPFPTAALL